jgi:cereblon
VRAKHQDQGIIVASVGTTAEIQQLGYCSDGSVNVVTKGRERFQIWRAWTEPDGAVLPLPPMPMWSDCDIMKN